MQCSMLNATMMDNQCKTRESGIIENLLMQYWIFYWKNNCI